MPTILDQVDDAVAATTTLAARSLVRVGGARGFGAGVVVHAAGLVLTAAHVLHDSSPRIAFEDGRTFVARVVAQDEALDLAALSLDAQGLPALNLGRPEDVQTGQLVLALGHPFGVPGVVAAGVVIGVGADGHRSGKDWLAVDMPLRPGNSGGPLIDAEARLIGISTMMAGPEIGLAVPIGTIRRFLRDSVAASLFDPVPAAA